MTISIVCWVIFLPLAAFVVPFTFQKAFPDTSIFVAYVIAAFLALIFFFVNSTLIDVLSGETVEGAKDGELAGEIERSAAKRMADDYLKQGKHKLAIVELENVQLYHQALKIAEEHKEFNLAGRLYKVIGNYDKARKMYELAGKYLEAGHMSNLLNKPREARELYEKQATESSEELSDLDKALLFDRAWNHQEALNLYQALDEHIRAAFVCEEMGLSEKADELRKKDEMLKNYERNQSRSEVVSPTVLEQRHKARIKKAKEFEEVGDFFCAGWYFAEADDFETAAESYEKIEEWRKAYYFWTKADDEVRAKKAFERIPFQSQADEPIQRRSKTQNRRTSSVNTPPPKQFPFTPSSKAVPKLNEIAPPKRNQGGDNQVARDLPKAPKPESFPSRKPFETVHQNPDLISVHFSDSALMWIEESKQKLQPLTYSNLLKVAGNFSFEEHLADAADLYLQLGKYDESVQCLRDGGKRDAAGIVCVGVGNYVRAIDLLVDELTDKPNPGLCLILAQLFVKLGDSESAMKLLKLRLAPRIQEQNAEHVYQFGRIMEVSGFLEEAYNVYGELLDSGAKSPELEKRVSDLREDIKKPKEETKPAYDPTSQEIKELSDTHKKIGAWYYISKFIEEDEEDDDSTAVALTEPVEKANAKSEVVNQTKESDDAAGKQKAPKPKLKKEFPFLPSDMRRDSSPDRVTQKPLLQMSLLGSAEHVPEENVLRLNNRYALTEILNEVEGCTEYLAQDELTNSTVKFFQIQSFGKDKKTLREYLLETRMISLIDHSNVLRIYDVGVVDLFHYLTVENVKGSSLASYLKKKGKCEPGLVASLLLQFAEGLTAFHQAGVIHSNLNSDNVFIGDDGTLKIDYDAVPRFRKSGVKESKHEYMLKLSYKAPEQVGATEAKIRQDVYALGIFLFHLIVGKTPLETITFESIQDMQKFHQKGKLPSILEFEPDTPKVFDQIFQYCTSPLEEKAYPNIEDLLSFLEELQEGV